jgi:hypothetical protein
MNKKEKKIPVGFIDSLKLKLIEFGVEYAKKNIEQSKKHIAKYIEKHLEKKIKKEIKKITSKIISISLLILGSVFLCYGLISMAVTLFNLPLFLTPILFGSIIIILSLIYAL